MELGGGCILNMSEYVLAEDDKSDSGCIRLNRTEDNLDL